MSPLGRLIALSIGLSAATVLFVAAYIRPSPTGIGSHAQLRLRLCQFEQTTGLPCPTCGMTTSFSHFVRGHVLASIYVQPMGFALAFLTASTVWAALYVAVTGWPIHRLLRFIPARYYLFPLFALGILAWIWKIWIHLNGHDGWG
jgi:hypothetical protein